jgi:DNA invertase Pin-like site-specific DNA recombinase
MAPRKTTRRILRAIVYFRVSSYDTAAEEAANQSPEVQRDRCLSRIRAEGWELAEDIGEGGVIFDLDVSGSDKGDRHNRPGLLIARQAIKARRADVIVSLRLDRLARNMVDLRTLAEELEANGGAFALAEGDINTAGPYGKLILTIIAAIAEMEARMITARTMAGKVAAREQGRWIGTRRPPFGYVKVAHPTIKDAWTLDLDPDAAPIVAELVRMVGEGATAYRLAHWLNDNGVRTQTGQIGKWTPTTVRDVFTHEAMVGRHYWQGDVCVTPPACPEPCSRRW